jgi:P4 family phage/plasmid primase-like protien
LNDNIFADHAPAYWGAGLPVIPLRQRNKMPDIINWSLYGHQMPDEVEQAHWLASFPNANVGLPLGIASGLCVIDIDTEDGDLIKAILDILPESPWVRTGKKGAALAYQFEGQKNFKLRGADGGMICEFLGQGNQVVVPPSIHPDTQKPYVATADLWDVKDDCPFLGEDIEDKLRALLGTKGFELGAGGRSSPIDVVPAGERGVQMVRHAGYLARVVLVIDRSAKFSLMEAMGHMYHWVETYTAKVSGDAIDPDKGVSKLLEFLMKDLKKGRTMPDGWDAGLSDKLRQHPEIVSLAELNYSQRWTVKSAQNWLSRKLDEKPHDDLDWMATSVDELIGLVARDQHFSDGHLFALIAYIKRQCKPLGLGDRALKHMFSRARNGTQHDEPESHRAIARGVLDDLKREGEIRFDHGQFWQWNGSCFEKLDADAVYMHVANNVTDAVLVRRHSDYKAIVEVLERMCKATLVQSEERGINFANGFVGQDLQLIEHDPKFGATFTLPFNYDRGNATRCPRWMDFLHDCWGHEPDFEERVDALQEMFAVTLFKIATVYQRAFLLFGRAGTGKTQILKVLRAMLPPDAVAELGPQHWGEKFTLVDLIGKAANICGELPENGMITGNVFKEVVEGSPVRTEFKNQDGFAFAPECANWFASNYLPVSRDSTRGFIRRWLILDFNQVIPEEKQVKSLAELLVAEEREAIAAWALEGLRRVLDLNGYTLPRSHEHRVGQMRRINNTVHSFLEDANGLVFEPAAKMKCRELYDAYCFHSKDVAKMPPVSFERFMQMLEDRDLDVERDVVGDYVVVGVRKVSQPQLRVA